MAKTLYVGNLPYSISDSELEDIFAELGSVESVRVVMDRTTGRSKGFGFVEMADDSEATGAISKLNGLNLNGREIKVNEARPKEAMR